MKRTTLILVLATIFPVHQIHAAQLLCNGIYSSTSGASDQKIKLTEELKLEKSKASYSLAESKLTTTDSRFEIQAYASMDTKGAYTLGIDINENKTNIMNSVVADSGKVSIFMKEGKSPHIKKIVNLECHVQK